MKIICHCIVWCGVFFYRSVYSLYSIYQMNVVWNKQFPFISATKWGKSKRKSKTNVDWNIGSYYVSQRRRRCRATRKEIHFKLFSLTSSFILITQRIHRVQMIHENNAIIVKGTIECVYVCVCVYEERYIYLHEKFKMLRLLWCGKLGKT